MEFHPVANIFPMMADAELAELAEDIKRNGLIEAIWTYHGSIIDGRNRYRACVLASEEPRFQEWRGDEKDLVQFVLSLNLKRRHLDASQRAVVGLAVERYEAERARERQATSAPGVYGGEPLLEKIPEAVMKGNARDIAAAAVSVNPRYIQDAKRIESTAPDLLPRIAAGEMTIPQAKREIVRRERDVPSPPLPTSRYRVLYADPPWYYAQQIEKYGPAERHYRTMQTEEICALGEKLRTIIEDNAVLFLWATSPKLEDALSVAKAWGFRYTGAMFVWDKVKHNYGHYNSVRHELLLICVRGSCTPDVPQLIDSVQTIERSDAHSEKPAEFRNLIDTLYPNGKRIELFARSAAAGWDVWGDQA